MGLLAQALGGRTGLLHQGGVLLGPFLDADDGAVDVAHARALFAAGVADGADHARDLGNHLLHRGHGRSEEHTSELQSPCNLVCRLLLEKKKKSINIISTKILRIKYDVSNTDVILSLGPLCTVVGIQMNALILLDAYVGALQIESQCLYL